MFWFRNELFFFIDLGFARLLIACNVCWFVATILSLFEKMAIKDGNMFLSFKLEVNQLTLPSCFSFLRKEKTLMNVVFSYLQSFKFYNQNKCSAVRIVSKNNEALSHLWIETSHAFGMVLNYNKSIVFTKENSELTTFKTASFHPK